MLKRFLVTSCWTDKTTRTPKASAAAINEGTSKQGNTFQFLQSDNTIQLDGKYSIGEILSYSMQLTSPQATQTTK